jgi:hypothetical protein
MSNQLDGLEPKDIIKKVTGKITKLFPERKFDGSYGPTSVQNGEIEVDGQAYKIAFWKCTQPESAKGRTITLSSTRGKQGLGGVTFEKESYEKEGKKIENLLIKVTASGKIEYDGATEEPVRVAASATPKSIVTDNPEKALDEIVETHLYIDSLVRMAYLGKVTDEETLRAYVSSVFIEANRKGISIGKPEPKPEPKAEEPAELNPKLWAEVIVPSGSHAGKKLGGIGKPELTKLYQYYLAKGFNTPFSKCVEQAAEDFHLDAPIIEEEEADEIPW